MDKITVKGIGEFEVDTVGGYIVPLFNATWFTDKQAAKIYRAAEKAFPDAICGEWVITDDRD